jgi:hypothetical protein
MVILRIAVPSFADHSAFAKFGCGVVIPGTSCLAWSLAVKELGRSVKHSGTELWLEFLRVVVQGGVGPEVGKRFGSNRCVP